MSSNLLTLSTVVKAVIEVEIVIVLLLTCLYLLPRMPKPLRAKYKRLRLRIRQFRLKIKKRLSYLIDLICAAFLIPLSALIPVKKDLVLIMGRENSGFLDNDKYLLIYLKQHGYCEKYDIRFMGTWEKRERVLKAYGFKVTNYPSLKTYWYIMRANLIITDNAHWTKRNRYNIAFKAKKIQLWHGIGFKKIRLSDEDFVKKSKGIKGFFRYVLQGQLATYDDFISTSDYFSKEVFEPSFKPRNIINIGYCRNDVLFDDIDIDELLMLINVDEISYNKVKKYKKDGYKIVIYSPTFRNAKTYNVTPDEVNFEELNQFAVDNNIIIVFKLHPLPKNLVDLSQYSNIIEYNSKCDVYPIFKYTDLMITDYSSIYLDYVLTDKPCLFFMYDLDFYRRRCRDLKEDFMDLLPGELCLSQDELVDALNKILIQGKDDYSEKRKEIRDLSWQDQSGHYCEKTWNYIENKYLIQDTPHKE